MFSLVLVISSAAILLFSHKNRISLIEEVVNCEFILSMSASLNGIRLPLNMRFLHNLLMSESRRTKCFCLEGFFNKVLVRSFT